MSDTRKQSSKKDFEKSLLESGMLSDVVVTCHGKDWKLHKFVLCSRSEWFRKALTGPWVEATTSKVVLGDEQVDKEAFTYFVEYIYSGATDEFDILLDHNKLLICFSNIYRLADYFIVPDLKRDVVDSLDRKYRVLSMTPGKLHVPRCVDNDLPDWIPIFFKGVDIAFEFGLAKDDPLQKFYIRLVRKSVNWCFKFDEFRERLEKRGPLVVAVTQSLLDHVESRNLTPVVSWQGGTEVFKCKACHKRTDEPIIAVMAPNDRARLVCFPCRRKVTIGFRLTGKAP